MIAFLLNPWVRNIAIGLALWAVIIGGLYWLYNRGFARGANEVRSAVAQQNAESAAVAARAWDNVNDCYYNGGEWDVEAGNCVK